MKESRGTTLTSLAGLTLAYNTVDNLKNPRSGIYAELKPDRRPRRRLASSSASPARPATTRRSTRTSSASRSSRAATSSRPARTARRTASAPSAAICGSSTTSSSARRWSAASRRPASARATSRRPTSSSNALGGTTYFGGIARGAVPDLPLIPRDLGLKGAVFADAGTLFGYKGRRALRRERQRRHRRLRAAGGSSQRPAGMHDRARQEHRSARRSAPRILWNSPLGPIRFDYAYRADEGRRHSSTTRATAPIRVGRTRRRPSASRAARASDRRTHRPPVRRSRRRRHA